MALQKGDTIGLDKIAQAVVYERELDVSDFVWRIKSFSSRDRILEHSFTSPKTGTQWKVIINPMKYTSRTCRVSTGFALEYTPKAFPVNTTCALHFLNSEMKVHRGNFYTHNFQNRQEIFEPFEYHRDSFLKADAGYVSDDGTLNLFIRMTIHTTDAEESPAVNLATVGQQYKTILENGEFSDLTLSTKTNSFPASKIILAVQSPVFKAMFLSDMLESKENVVKIEDFSDETVKGLLEFLYTGQCESLEENALELLKISDKYEVFKLKRECQQILINKLNKDNAAEMFILANVYNASELKSQVVAFVKMCRKEVAETESFKEMKKTHSEILLDLYSSFV